MRFQPEQPIAWSTVGAEDLLVASTYTLRTATNPLGRVTHLDVLGPEEPPVLYGTLCNYSEGRQGISLAADRDCHRAVLVVESQPPLFPVFGETYRLHDRRGTVATISRKPALPAASAGWDVQVSGMAGLIAFRRQDRGGNHFKAILRLLGRIDTPLVGSIAGDVVCTILPRTRTGPVAFDRTVQFSTGGAHPFPHAVGVALAALLSTLYGPGSSPQT